MTLEEKVGQLNRLSGKVFLTGPGSPAVRDPVASIVRPVEELKGFQRIVLAPGERRTLSFAIDREMLAFYDDRMRWTAEPGKFELMVGSASDDIRLRAEIELTD